MAPSLYDQFVYAVNSGDRELVETFLKKNKDKFSEATRIAIAADFPALTAA
jgi:hypothetical protein